MPQYASYSGYTGGGGGGGGGINDINGQVGPGILISAGPGISITSVGDVITIGNSGDLGTPNTFAGFDGGGVLESVPGFNINTNGGLNEQLTESPNNLGFQSLNEFDVNFTPLQNSPNEGWNIQSIQASLDVGSSGFSQGTAGVAVQLLNLDMTHHGTGNVGGLNNLVMNSDLGNGVDPITIQGIGYSYGFGNIHANVTLDGSIQGYTFQPNIDAAAIGTSNFSVAAFSEFTNVGIPVNGYNVLNAGSVIFAITNNHNYNGVNLNPGITTLQGNAGFTGFGSYGTITTMSATGQYVGLQVNPNITTSHGNINGIQISPTVAGGDANFTGIQINPNGAVVFGSAQGININLNNITSNDPQGVTGINSDSRLSINAETTLKPNQGFQIGNRIESLFHVPSGSPVTGTDSLGNDFAGDLEAEDNIALGPIGLGWASVGFIADMAVAAGKTVAAVDVFVPAVALPDPGFPTGGAVTDMTMIRTFAPLSQGGTLAITNLYGFKIDSSLGGPFSGAATNTWGLFLEDPALQNFIEGHLAIGTTSTKVSSANIGLESVGSIAVGVTHTVSNVHGLVVGTSNTISNVDAVSFGSGSVSSGPQSSSMGLNTTASGNHSHAENINTIASGPNSHAEGFASHATAQASHSEGINTISSNAGSHAEGNATTASGNGSHAEGQGTIASGDNSHAEGDPGTTASGEASHAEGNSTQANGDYSHSQGDTTIANGEASFSGGLGTDAEADQQTVVGTYNVLLGTPGAPSSTDELFTVGNGANSGARATAFAVLRNGNAKVQGGLSSATLTPANGATGTFTTVDLKTVTVTNGIITSIV